MLATWKSLTISMAGALSVAIIITINQTGASVAGSALIVGEMAPNFVGTDANGVEHQLSDYTGQTVILEWTNDQCPYVQKHYDPSQENMQSLQKAAAADNIVWLTVISSAEGKQGHVSPEEAIQLTEARDATPAAVLLDTSGEIGRLYGAQTTPHMFIIGEGGELAYAGAIDDRRSTQASHIPSAKNYVRNALAEMKAGKPVSEPFTLAYGCSVKYRS